MGINGTYSVYNGWCHFQLFANFASPGGGKGQLKIPLPVTAVANLSQVVSCFYYLPGVGNFAGLGYISSGELDKVAPYFPTSLTNNALLGWQSANDAGNTATGVPLNSGGWSVLAGCALIVQGSYRVVATS
jgi:hypothetical protein